MYKDRNEEQISNSGKYIFFWFVFLTMVVFFIAMINDNLDIVQKDLVINVSLKNKVNICSPQYDLDNQDVGGLRLSNE